MSVSDYNDPTRPTLTDRWYKAHGLGNDYLIFEAGDEWVADGRTVEAVCARTTGVGGDGIVALMTDREPFDLRMFNPDGGEFERSGNGLRILGSWLHRSGRVGEESFRIRTGGDEVAMRVHGVAGSVYDISVEMGRAEVGAAAVELSEERVERRPEVEAPALAFRSVANELLSLVPVSVGNPHAVVWGEPQAFARLDEALLHRLGARVAADPAFRNGVNVQLARVLDRDEAGGVIEIRIWERGVGPTSASGTSSCAAAVAAVATGRLAPGDVRVRMPGGELRVTVSSELEVVLRGPVQAVGEGRLDREWLVDVARR